MRIRIRYAEHGKIRFVGHRDLANAWERAIRRVGLPVKYSEGFSPRPRLHFGLALSVGYESDAEYLDVDLVEDVPLEGLADRLTAAMPRGIDVLAVGEIPSGSEALQSEVTSVTWWISVPLERDELQRAVTAFLAAPTMEVEVIRKRKPTSIDIRALVDDVTLEDAGDTAILDGRSAMIVDIRTRPRGARPAELVESIVGDVESFRVRRLGQWIDDDTGRRPPMGLDGTSGPVDDDVARGEVVR